MIARDNEPESLDLAGYVALAEHGFALPCFASGPQSNIWYTAVCSVSGDHLGKVNSFEPFACTEIRPIKPNLIRSTGIGDPWCDVFLWAGEHYVGEPSELWDALSPVRAEIAARAPLSLLDVGVCTPNANQADLARSAYDYVRSHFGEQKAGLWRRDTFLRQHIILHLKRLRRSGHLTSDQNASRGIEIEEQNDENIQFYIPKELLNELTSTGHLASVEGELKRITSAFDLTATITEAPELELMGAATADHSNVANQRSVESPQMRHGESSNILIVALGKRAGQLARHINSAEWAPVWTPDAPHDLSYSVTHFLAGQSFEKPLARGGSIHVAHNPSKLPQVDLYSVFFILMDDELLKGSEASGDKTKIFSELSLVDSAARVLVPSLPLDRPTRTLSFDPGWNRNNKLKLDAVLDTATARSPFWSGNQKRAVDRRIADNIVAAAILSSYPGPLFDFLVKRTSTHQPALLTFGLQTRRSHFRSFQGSVSQLAMASEATWAPTDTQPDLAHQTYFSSDFGIVWFDKRSGWPTKGRVEMREGLPHFRTFGLAVVEEIMGSRVDKLSRQSSKAIPKKIMRSLTFPEHVCGIGLNGKARSLNLLVTAETPSIETIKVAADDNWAVIRYTDQETLQDLLKPGADIRDIPLPREVQLSTVRRLPQNRRLAVRGIDPRDAVRLSAAQLVEWRGRRVSFLDRARRYRASIGESDNDSFVLPLADLLEAVELGERAARDFLRWLQSKTATRPHSLKRPADLRTAWNPPPKGCKRFVVADGVVPIVLVEILPDEIPAQKLFIVDGDLAVPALLKSKVFEIWARATLSRSTSWMSRFSMSKTFETFPIVRPFELKQQSEDSLGLLLRQGDKKLYQLVREWAQGTKPDGSLNLRSNNRSAQRHRPNPFQRRLDSAILDVYGLPPNASDLAILERLLVTNSRS